MDPTTQLFALQLATPSAAGASTSQSPLNGTAAAGPANSNAPTSTSTSMPPPNSITHSVDPLLLASIFHATVPLALLIPGAPGPLLVNAPRNCYLPALLATIPHIASLLLPPSLLLLNSHHPSDSVDAAAGGQLAFVCAQSKTILKWYYPIGVLFDVHRPTPPWLPVGGDSQGLSPSHQGASGTSDRGSSSGDDDYAHIESPNAPTIPVVDDAHIKALVATPWQIHVLVKRPLPLHDTFAPLFPAPLLPDPDPDRTLSPAALDTLVPYTSLDTLAAVYRNEVKQAEYIKYGSSKKTNAMGKADSELLWDAVVNNNLTNAEPLMTTLFHTDPIARAWPIRVHIHPALKSPNDTRPYLQPLLPVTLDTVGQVIQGRLGFGHVSVVVQGLHLTMDTPLAWVHRHLVCVDGWMHLVVVPLPPRATTSVDAGPAVVADKDDTDLVLVDP